jgi:hypothetical protein
MMVKLVETLSHLELDFEDIIMFSDVDEIPDFKTLDLIDDYLIFNSIILRQKRFFWTTKYIDKDLSFGTSCHQYTKISRNPLVLEHFYNLKSNKKFSNNLFLDSGWHFSHFEDLGNLHKKLELINGKEYSIKDLKLKMNNLVPIKSPDLQDEYSLMDYEGDLPKNIYLLPEQPVRRNWKRNILIKTKDITNDGDFFQTINVSFLTNSINKIDENTIMFVIIHECAHLMTESTGHTPEFWTNFRKLLHDSIKVGIYHPQNYTKNPVDYCGMTISDTPL